MQTKSSTVSGIADPRPLVGDGDTFLKKKLISCWKMKNTLTVYWLSPHGHEHAKMVLGGLLVLERSFDSILK